MKIKMSIGEIIFEILNYVLMTLLVITMLYPLLYTLTISVSSAADASRAGLHILPNFSDMDFSAYKTILATPELWKAYGVTLARTVIGTVLAVFVTILYSYALSKKHLPLRKFFTMVIMVPMFFAAGQIPAYLNIKSLNLVNNFWVYILPSLITTYNVIISRSFFSSIPEALYEAAKIDGAREFRVFFSIVLPLSKAIIMTLALWIAVGHWNSWYDSVMYMTDPSKITLQNYLQRIINESSMSALSKGMEVTGLSAEELTPKTVQSATIMVSVLPILAFYPFVQKYFLTGVTLGSVKG